MQNERLNPKTTLQVANDSLSFDFKVQLRLYLPLIIPWSLYPPQVDLMYFFLVADIIFRCDP